MALDDKREFRTVIVHGPAGCGKTYHAADLARALGCGAVVDDWGYVGAGMIFSGALHLTHDRPAPGSVPDDVLIMPFSAALAAAFVVGAI